MYLFFAITIAGCSPHAGNGVDSRVAAVVNGVEITRREVNFFYQRTAPQDADESVARNQRRNILAGLVRAELLAQQATKMKLDQSPDFLLAMHDARRRVLAGLAEEEIASTVKPVSPETVQKIISNNPNFFAQRKLLVYEEVVIQGVNVPFLESLNVSAGRGASLTELLDLVKAQKVPFRRATRTLTSDQIEPVILKVLSNSRVNVPVVMRVEDKFSMMLMLHTVVPVPLEGLAAEQAATNLLNNQQRAVAFSNKVKAVVDAASITYFGEYRPDAPGTKGNLQVVALPMPDSERAQKERAQQIGLAVSLSLSFTSAMLLLIASKSIINGTLWLPKLWPVPKRNASAENSATFIYHENRVSFIVQLTLFLVALSSLLALGYHLFLLWERIPLWMMFFSVAAGLLIGKGIIHLYVISGLLRLAEKMRKFRWLPVMLVAALLLASGVLVSMRIVGT